MFCRVWAFRVGAFFLPEFTEVLGADYFLTEPTEDWGIAWVLRRTHISIGLR